MVKAWTSSALGLLIAAIGGCAVAVVPATPSPSPSTTLVPSPPVSAPVPAATSSAPIASSPAKSPPVATPSKGSPSAASASPEIAGTLEELVAELTDAGADVRELARESMGSPALFRDVVVLCVNSRRVGVHRFPSEQERARVTARIDPDIPSELGDASVTWTGTPWYWEAGRIVVIYVGGRTETAELLTSILGAPFAGGNPERDEPQSSTRC